MADTIVSTRTVARRERESLWHHALADTFAAVQLERWTDHHEPEAELRATRRGRLLFAELHATPHVHRRTPRQIRQADAAYFQMAILTSGTAYLQQHDRTAALQPGDLVAYENSEPFTWTFTDPWAATVLSIPGDAIGLALSERHAISARRLSGHHGLSGVVARFVLDLTRHAGDIPDTQTERVLAQTTDLAISLFATAANTEYSDARHRSILDRIKAHIAQHFRDPALTPEHIAAAANISTRYLHKVFQTEHDTVALYLRNLRLHHVRQELLDPRLTGHSIASIAHRNGFGDISGFNRVFKTAYGITPSDLRSAPRTTTSRPTGC